MPLQRPRAGAVRNTRPRTRPDSCAYGNFCALGAASRCEPALVLPDILAQVSVLWRCERAARASAAKKPAAPSPAETPFPLWAGDDPFQMNQTPGGSFGRIAAKSSARRGPASDEPDAGRKLWPQSGQRAARRGPASDEPDAGRKLWPQSGQRAARRGPVSDVPDAGRKLWPQSGQRAADQRASRSITSCPAGASNRNTESSGLWFARTSLNTTSVTLPSRS